MGQHGHVVTVELALHEQPAGESDQTVARCHLIRPGANSLLAKAKGGALQSSLVKARPELRNRILGSKIGLSAKSVTRSLAVSLPQTGISRSGATIWDAGNGQARLKTSSADLFRSSIRPAKRSRSSGLKLRVTLRQLGRGLGEQDGK